MKKIKLFVTDVDGTMTDGRFTIDEFGNETKTFNVKDGTAFKLLRDRGIKTAVITGHDSKVVEQRCKYLKIDYYYVSTDKVTVLKKIIEENNIHLDEVAYIGDDLNDLDIIKIVGYSGCPKDACKEINNMVNYVCDKKGGYGAVRDFVEHLLIL